MHDRQAKHDSVSCHGATEPPPPFNALYKTRYHAVNPDREIYGHSETIPGTHVLQGKCIIYWICKTSIMQAAIMLLL